MLTYLRGYDSTPRSRSIASSLELSIKDPKFLSDAEIEKLVVVNQLEGWPTACDECIAQEKLLGQGAERELRLHDKIQELERELQKATSKQ